MGHRWCMLVAGSGTSSLSLVSCCSSFARCDARYQFNRAGDAEQRSTEIGKVHQGEEQAGHPEDMLMREESQQAQDGDDFELQLLRFVSHPLRKSVQTQKHVADCKNRDDQDDSHRYHQRVGLAWRCDETRQVMGGSRVRGCAHTLAFRGTCRTENHLAIRAGALREAYGLQSTAY